ncbi:phage major tail tube protein [Pseudomonas aeruginosa]
MRRYPSTMGLEAMEAKFCHQRCPPRKQLNFFGLADQSAFNGVFRGSFKGQKGAGACQWWLPCAGLHKEVDPGDWKAGAESRPQAYAVAVSYYKLEVDGREVYEIDPVNGVRAINVSTSWPACATTSACKRSSGHDPRESTAGLADAGCRRRPRSSLASGTVQRGQRRHADPACTHRA